MQRDAKVLQLMLQFHCSSIASRVAESRSRVVESWAELLPFMSGICATGICCKREGEGGDLPPACLPTATMKCSRSAASGKCNMIGRELPMIASFDLYRLCNGGGNVPPRAA